MAASNVGHHPLSNTSFATLGLKPGLANNLGSLGYHSMTPIQAASLPSIMDGKDVVGQGKTGSGKTAAFVLGMLQKLDVKNFRIQSLVLCPTRELADQVAKETRRLARGIHNIKVLTLCGGQPIGPQLGSLSHGAHIIVGTPGRIEEHLRKRTLDLSSVNMFVLDEADRMLDMGFQPSLDEIVKHVPNKRQTLLFSATFPKEIQQMSARVMKSPVRVEVESTHDGDSIQQFICQVRDDTDRLDVIRLLLLLHRPDSALVFCNTKRETDEVAAALAAAGFTTKALHGDMEQRDRDETLATFSNKSITVLVATDVAARGLDVNDIEAVFNYQLARDDEVHVHRIGRTARAGKKGIAVSLFTDREIRKVEQLEAFLGQAIETLPPMTDNLEKATPYKPPMLTLQIDGGRKQKVRPGDILGALTKSGEISGDEVGKIQIFDQSAYIAVRRNRADEALAMLSQGKVKGRSFRARRIR